MKQNIWRRLSALVLACLAGLLLALPAAAEDASIVALPATLTLSGTMPADAAPYYFTLQAQNAANPMPAGAEGDTKKVSVDKAGVIDFGNITFTNIGVYAYTISQVKGSAKDCTYDSRIYTATVYVQWKNEVGGPVETVLVLTLKDSTTKPDKIAFENVGTTPVPTATTSPVPTATTSPVPTATTSPVPTATTSPVPTATTRPAPTATTSPSPTATANPVPTAVPTATGQPTPTPTATPVPIGNGDGDTGGTNHGGKPGEDDWATELTTGALEGASSSAAASEAEKAALMAYLSAHGLLPQTSDDEPLLLWVVLAGVSLVGFVVLLLLKRRKNKNAGNR